MDRKKLEALVYRHTHPDFKGKLEDGTKTILKFISGSGTCLVPVSSLTDEELLDKLPKKVKESREFQRNVLP